MQHELRFMRRCLLRHLMATAFVLLLGTDSGRALAQQAASPAECIDGANGVRRESVHAGPKWADTLGKLRGIRRIEGSLEIVNVDLRDLVGLECLSEITGNLRLGDLKLVSLEGLHNLASIGGGLNLTYNANLANLDGLRGLRQVSGAIGIYFNSKLTSIGALAGIKQPLSNPGSTAAASSQFGIVIQRNETLRNLRGLEGIRYAGRVSILDNEHLLTLSGLDGLAEVQDLLIADNPQLRDLALPSLVSVGTRPRIFGSPALTPKVTDRFSGRVGQLVDRRTDDQYLKETDPTRYEVQQKARAKKLAWKPFAWLALWVWLAGAAGLLLWPATLLVFVLISLGMFRRWKGIWRYAGLPTLLTFPIPLHVIETTPMGNMTPPLIFGVWVVGALGYVGMVWFLADPRARAWRLKRSSPPQD